MSHDPFLEKFSRFARAQYKTETKVWIYFFAVISIFIGVMNWWTGEGFGFSADSFLNGRMLSVLLIPFGIFVFLCTLRLVGLFVWYFIIFWALRWFPSIRREKFSAQRR